MRSILTILLLLPLLSISAELKEIRYPVAADNSMQPALMQLASKPNQPLLLALHSWSGDYKQASSKKYAMECAKRDWNLIFPNFRGPNSTPQACGSELVIADLLAAIEHAKKAGNADPSRIYVMGESGGGYATLLIAARHPEVFAAASAWVPIFDLAKWHADNKKTGRKYWKMLEASTGGAPGASTEVDHQYAIRSAKHWLSPDTAKNLKIHVNTGIHDGHKGSVPVDHALLAFNAIAPEADRLTDAQIQHFVDKQSVPPELKKEKQDDPTYGKKNILFRRTAGNATITVFDGGHESITPAGIAWLAQLRKNH